MSCISLTAPIWFHFDNKKIIFLHHKRENSTINYQITKVQKHKILQSNLEIITYVVHIVTHTRCVDISVNHEQFLSHTNYQNWTEG